MLGQSFLRGIRKKLPWYQSIRVKIVSVHGRSLFLENLSDLKRKRKTVRRYSLVVYPELNHVDPSNKNAVNGLDGELADLFSCYAVIDFKSDELWHYVVSGIYRTYRGRLEVLPARHT